jgi:hypothetical protein
MIATPPRLSPIVLAAAGLLCVSASADAQDWMYRRSYFSHSLPEGVEAPPHPVPESRSAYRTAYYNEGAGFTVRSAYRINNFVLQNGGRVDRTYYREGWLEVKPF